MFTMDRHWSVHAQPPIYWIWPSTVLTRYVSLGFPDNKYYMSLPMVSPLWSSGQRIQRAMPAVVKLLVGPLLPDRSMWWPRLTATPRSSGAGGWVCSWLLHTVKIYIVEKAQVNHFGRCEWGWPKREQDNEIRMNIGSWNVRRWIRWKRI
jgi:hypothetical protein